MDKITASSDTLMNQAGDTADVWMSKAVRSIDRLFGKGYAEKNPELVASFMKVAATDQFTSVMGSIIQDSTDEICRYLRDI